MLFCDAHDLRRLVRFEKIDFAAQQLGNEDSHQLAKHVAERQQTQEAKGMHESLPARILLQLVFDRSEVSEQVAVRETNTFGFGSRAGGENDLYKIVRLRGNR